MLILYYIFSIVCLVCWIMEIIAAFKKGKGPLMGILSIIPCPGIGGFIIGWIHAKKWGISKIMLIWTIAWILSLVTGAIAGAFSFQMQVGQ